MIRSTRSASKAPRGKMLHILAQRIAVFLVLCLSLAAPLHAGFINPGDPTINGPDTIVVRVKGVRTKVVVNTLAAWNKRQKAVAIRNALRAAGINARVARGGVVVVPKTRIISWVSMSGEKKDKIKQEGIPGRGSTRTKIDRHLRLTFADLAGIDSDGNPASYTAGFEFISPSLGDISLLTSLGFADLTTPTLTGLLQQEFDLLMGQLQIQAPSLVSDLWLNPAKGAIYFQPSGIFTSASAINGTTDVALTTSLSVSRVPEPSSLIMMGTGLLLLALGGYARRRVRQPRTTLTITGA